MEKLELGQMEGSGNTKSNLAPLVIGATLMILAIVVYNMIEDRVKDE